MFDLFVDVRLLIRENVANDVLFRDIALDPIYFLLKRIPAARLNVTANQDEQNKRKDQIPVFDRERECAESDIDQQEFDFRPIHTLLTLRRGIIR